MAVKELSGRPWPCNPCGLLGATPVDQPATSRRYGRGDGYHHGQRRD
jgi:hypothetical protein